MLLGWVGYLEFELLGARAQAWVQIFQRWRIHVGGYKYPGYNFESLILVLCKFSAN